jgi:NACalpha-BTF3-like transcription factor
VSYNKNDSSKSPGSLEDDEDLALAARIRDAARKLPLNSMLDLTDQHGTNVSMTQTDRLAFVMALGLHRLGRERMDHEERMSSALALLLEADSEWRRVGDDWRNKVDNYGLLQLDIAWIYFKLRSLTHLPDAIQRLEAAETALRKQVNKNFVTLALAQADMGRPVPPLAAVFCRLFLLQGTAYSYSPGHQSRSQERLDWARVLCQSLRNVAPEPAVDVLCEAAGVSRCQAISVLRRTYGDADKAIGLLQESRANEVRQAQRREIQREIGLCSNAKDHVNLDLVNSLESMLGFSPVSSDTAQGSEGDSKPSLSMAYRVAAGLLRLADNDIQRAIDMYSQELNRSPDAVLERIAALDKRFEEQNIMSRSQRKRRRRGGENDAVAVDEVALASLISMGVDESVAREALRCNENNFEQALLWMTGQDDTMNDEGDNEDEAAANTSTSDPEGVESEANQASAALQDNGQEIAEAEEFLREELGDALSDNDIEKEYLGSTLDEEWAFLVSMQPTLNEG